MKHKLLFSDEIKKNHPKIYQEKFRLVCKCNISLSSIPHNTLLDKKPLETQICDTCHVKKHIFSYSIEKS